MPHGGRQNKRTHRQDRTESGQVPHSCISELSDRVFVENKPVTKSRFLLADLDKLAPYNVRLNMPTSACNHHISFWNWP